MLEPCFLQKQKTLIPIIVIISAIIPIPNVLHRLFNCSIVGNFIITYYVCNCNYHFPKAEKM